MSHDLKAINAALRLGDLFFPPRDAICRFLCDSPDCGIHCVVIIGDDSVDGNEGNVGTITGNVISRLDGDDWWPVEVGENVCWSILYLKEILEVPSSAPPFREWERP